MKYALVIASSLLFGCFVAQDDSSADRSIATRSWRSSTQVAFAVDAAHRAGVVHRDLKPSNIMLVPPPSAGRSRPRRAAAAHARYTARAR